jgi:HAMP domain-containing protein/signal transduction histidine kinase/CheY-like chemotaxis protein
MATLPAPTTEDIDIATLLTALRALRKGDFSARLPVRWLGLAGKVADTFNDIVEMNERLAAELERLNRVVGKQGKIAQRAATSGMTGGWVQCVEAVNSLIDDLVSPTREMARVIGAVAKGDLSQSMALETDGGRLEGEFRRTAMVVNSMVDQLGSFASEVTRVVREVGTEGKLGGQARVRRVAGTWKDLTDSVNSMAGNLTGQVRNIAEVTTAVANGDLSKKITVDVKGEFFELKNTINTMVDQLRSFGSEVTRVAREVGTEGRLGGQAKVEGVSGTWKDLTDSVNFMASNLTSQVRNIAEVTKAVAAGDLSRKITVDVKGEILELKNTVNTMVDQLSSFAAEVTRMAREVGTEGRLGGQADVRDVAGTWKDLTDSVNFMASNLTSQVRNIAEVTKAVAAGDLSRKITVDVKGEILELKNTVNTMVDQLRSFAAEVTRVAREVGTEGRLGGQADVKDVAGTWKDLTDSVNFMASNLTSQVRNIAEVTTAVANGDLSRKITVDVRGEILELKNTVNTMVDQLRSFAAEVTRVAREVGTEGRLGGQADVRDVAGTWKDLTDSVNFMASNLTSQVRNIAEVTKAVAAGDLSKKITVEVKGEILELKNTVNTMVDQLSSFAAEVTRVAREVGTEGKLGGQAQVQGVSGTWRGLTENVNFMAANLTGQVRGIAKVVTAVANGDLRQKLTVEAKGEIAELANTINSMIDTLATFADQVTTVAREVGVDGELGGQARVPGAAGTWKDLTDNVNQLAANLTTQVRAIAEVATAVTKGDLTQSISVEAQGEVAALKDNINTMIRNLKDTTLKNSEQDWLKTNLAKFSRMLQGQKDLLTVARLILSELAPVVKAQQGAFYILKSEGRGRLALLAGYAHERPGGAADEFGLGEGLIGQCAVEREKMMLTAPPDYIRISSGLGRAAPVNVIVLPILFEGQIKAVLELASFEEFTASDHALLDQLTESIGIVINTIEANMRTEDLLAQSQSLAVELQSRQEELQNQEVEQARKALEEKAEQLALTSKYKSEFLANMSHELRTPLNSLLILSDQLSKNSDGNLTSKQTEFAKTIHSSGTDLLMLINDILDLSKIESGTVAVDLRELRLTDLRTYVERTFRHVAEAKGLKFAVQVDPEVPPTMVTDAKRLQQVIKNLLANAFKFTSHGRVSLTIGVAAPHAYPESESLRRASEVLSFAVADTGIGIPADKQQIVFEAFQQADGSTNRKYGGTGLGLAISREIARLLGGEIHLVSTFGLGSTFILYLPQSYAAPAAVRPEPAALAPAPGWPAIRVAEASPAPSLVSEVEDDRDVVEAGDRTLLIVENDLAFARLLVDVGREAGFKSLVTASGASGLALARQYRPSAITLDISLPDIDGWRVLERLKRDLGTRHIPVKVISTGDDLARSRQLGAASVLRKPVRTRDDLLAALTQLRDAAERPRKDLVIVHPDGAARETLSSLLAAEDVEVLAVPSVSMAAERLRADRVDCLVVASVGDEELREGWGDARLETAREIPLIAFGPPEWSERVDRTLKARGSDVTVICAVTPERLLDQCALRLHRPLDRLPERQRQILHDLHTGNGVLTRRKVLIVDDDIRNIFALTSILERQDMIIRSAETGRNAIETLDKDRDIDVVLMDLMMPEMDGLETIRAIREDPRFRSLTIIAVTAKAMKGDREKCIEAGASDYIAKPVDPEELVAKLRDWLLR